MGLHVVIPTHAAHYLDLALAALARQSRRADSVIVSCDNDDADIGAEAERCAQAYGLPVWWVRRETHHEERLCQVRNNAARHLRDTLGERTGRVVVIDRDMVLPDATLAGHERLGASAPLVYAYRIDVDEQASARLSGDHWFAGDDTLTPTAQQLDTLVRRDRRYRKHLLLRRLRLAPPHKPKLLGGHFSCDLGVYLAINGFDELYRGWGFKDDEFAHRAARSGHRCAVGVRALPAFHLFHPTRQPDRPMRELPNAQRFAGQHGLPLVCENGVENPLPQHPVRADLFAP